MDWSALLGETIKLVVEALIPILLSIITYGSYLIKKKIDDKLDTQQKKDMADLVVRFVEQTLREATNEEKKAEAVKKFAELLDSKNIHITDVELNMYIESSVNAVKSGITKADNENKTLQG